MNASDLDLHFLVHLGRDPCVNLIVGLSRFGLKSNVLVFDQVAVFEELVWVVL